MEKRISFILNNFNSDVSEINLLFTDIYHFLIHFYYALIPSKNIVDI